MKINVLNNNFREIVDAVMLGKDIRCLDFSDETIKYVMCMEVSDLFYAVDDGCCLFVEVIDEN